MSDDMRSSAGQVEESCVVDDSHDILYPTLEEAVENARRIFALAYFTIDELAQALRDAYQLREE